MSKRSTLSESQREFALLVSKLIRHIYRCGYEVTLGDAYRDPRVHGKIGEKKSYSSANSNHKRKLAIDLNLFHRNEYLSATEDHRQFGLYWESLHEKCRWGGRFNDGNHYEYVHEGYDR